VKQYLKLKTQNSKLKRVYMPSNRHFLKLAIANIISNLMVPLAGLMDVAFLGHLAEIRHLAGVAIATVLFNYIYWTFGFLRMGTTGMTAQAVGRGDRQEVGAIGLRNGLLALGIGILILILHNPLREIGFTLLSATPEVKAAGITFYNALIWGAPATLVNFVLIGWFLGQGKGRNVLILSVIGNVSNVILDYLLIVRLGWESAGAGYGTALAQYLMLLTGGFLLTYETFSHSLPDSRSAERSCRNPLLTPIWLMLIAKARALFPKVLNAAALKASFTLNSDILIRTFALVSTFALFTNLSSQFGTTVLAINTLLLQVITLAAYFIDGLAFATESFAGTFRGKGVTDPLRDLAKFSGGLGLICGLIFAFVFAIAPIPLFSLLTHHENVVSGVSQYVIWLFPVLGFASIAYILDGYYLGLTEGRILRISTLIASGVGFLPGAIAAGLTQSNHMLWLALTSFMAARAIALGSQLPKTWQPD
jgi:multidrug resistance protein, MATE family